MLTSFINWASLTYCMKLQPEAAVALSHFFSFLRYSRLTPDSCFTIDLRHGIQLSLPSEERIESLTFKQVIFHSRGSTGLGCSCSQDSWPSDNSCRLTLGVGIFLKWNLFILFYFSLISITTRPLPAPLQAVYLLSMGTRCPLKLCRTHFGTMEFLGHVYF